MIRNLLFTYNFIKHNKKLFAAKNKSKKKILVDFFQYKPSMIVFSYISNILAEIYNAEIIATECDLGEDKIKSFLKNIIQKNFFLSNWNIFKSFGAKELIVSNFSQEDNFKSKKIYNNLLKKIKNKDDVLNIKIMKVDIGDLIYDDYLREKRYTTINIHREDFKQHLFKMVRLFVFWKNYIDNNDIKACLISHSVYKFGIVARIAISKNIKVIYSGLACTYSLDKKNKLSSVGYSDYPKTFRLLKRVIKKDLHKIAKIELKKKLAGKTDMTQIINQTQKVKSFEIKKNVKTKFINDKNKLPIVLIAAHCFTDAVHAFDKMIFPDFHEWIEFLGDLSNKTNYQWLVKLHPADFDANKKYIDYFINKYPKLKLVNKFATHNDLLNKNIKAVLTVNGSIGHEYPLFGVPVVNAHPSGSNPHCAYNFNFNPKTIKELRKIILNIEKIKFRINDKLKKEIYEYYYTRVFADYWFLPDHKKIYLKLNKKVHTAQIFGEWLKIFNLKLHKLQKQNYTAFIKSGKYRMLADTTNKLPKIIMQ